MGKKKVPRRIRDRERQLQKQQSPPTTEKRSNLLLTLEKTVGVILGLLTIAGFLLSNAPKLSVDVSGSLQPTKPLDTLFYLSNDGILPVHDIETGCGEIQFKAGDYTIDMEHDARFVLPESKAEILSPGHKMTLPCDRVVGIRDPALIARITRAEITIFIDYRPDFVPWHKKARFPWKAEKTESGSWIWKSLPR